jgi:uncharacterized membrane protein YoaK (UPF0700 family)
MFRYRGKNRTLLHNIQLASVLSFVAGVVNVTGFFAFHQLTTNVTGHFAFFADEVIRLNWETATIYLLYILSFFAGAFVSNLLVEFMIERDVRLTNVVPVLTEIVVLAIVALLSYEAQRSAPNLMVCSLLFAMGLQNALVTSISNAQVRTTHLTGLFTDLGIELSQLFFFRKHEQRARLKASVKLRLVIISFFFLGCIVGGYAFAWLHTLTLFIGVACLIGGLTYSAIKLRLARLRREIIG